MGVGGIVLGPISPPAVGSDLGKRAGSWASGAGPNEGGGPSGTADGPACGTETRDRTSHQRLPPKTLVVGEIDLTRRIRTPKPSVFDTLACLLANHRRGEMEVIYLADRAADDLAGLTSCGDRVGDLAEVRGVPDLDTPIRRVWTSLFD